MDRRRKVSALPLSPGSSVSPDNLCSACRTRGREAGWLPCARCGQGSLRSVRVMDMAPGVLQLFKALHRTRKEVFRSDSQALEAARQKINSEFRNNLTESSPERVAELLKLGSDVAVILRKTVIQGVLTNRNTIFLRPRKEVLLDNLPFNDNPTKKTT